MTDGKKHIFICGAKSIGQYGGYESFLDRLTEQHQDHPRIQYYIVTKKNGDGRMDETKLEGVRRTGHNRFVYHNAKVLKIDVPQIGAAQAILYDILALRRCIAYAKKKQLEAPIFMVLACRIGPFFAPLVREIHRIGGIVYVNPDGHEWLRAKWSRPVRAYWKQSERLMVKHADLLICDSVNIEAYIRENYRRYDPNTVFIAYGSDIRPSALADDDPCFTGWLAEKGLEPGQYYMCCGRLVPENSFETMIREFMASKTERKFAIIANQNDKYFEELKQKLQFEKDPRICFAGTVYDTQLLKKIRENAWANFHGHTVGGTNPSLLEALGATDLNLLVDVCFNREVAQEAALYWTKDPGSLAALINRADRMSAEEKRRFGQKAKARVREAYSWEFIAGEYEKAWEK